MEEIMKSVVRVQGKKRDDRPQVTVTWAQSLDGRLSSAKGEQTAISGPESMQMTHALRALHDGILVGSNTVLTDKPRLSTRPSSQTTEALSASLSNLGVPPREIQNPVPIILDSKLRTPTTTPCLHTQLPSSKRPLIFTTSSEGNPALQEFAEIISVDSMGYGGSGVSLPCAMKSTLDRDISSVMIEGGASVLSSFMNEGIWDLAIVTVAPTLFGSGVTMASPDGALFKGAQFARSEWVRFGSDFVLIGYRE